MNDWSLKYEFSLLGFVALSQLDPNKKRRAYWHKRSLGLSKLKTHILTERAKMTPEFKRSIILRDHFTCYLCGHYKCWKYGQPMVIEHDIPLVRWGYTTYENCWLSCWHCNARKDTMTAEEYWGRKK